MTGESPTRPGYLYPHPLVDTADATLPRLSIAMKLTVPSSSPVTSRTIGVSDVSRAMDAGVWPASRNRATQSARVSAVSSSASSAPISRAKRPAPAPTSMTCGSRSITARATLIGWRNPVSAATEPAAWLVPSTIDASSSTSPSTFGRPPRPTLRSSGSASTTRAHASTASRALPPRARMRIPMGSAARPLPLETIVGSASGLDRTLSVGTGRTLGQRASLSRDGGTRDALRAVR